VVLAEVDRQPDAEDDRAEAPDVPEQVGEAEGARRPTALKMTTVATSMNAARMWKKSSAW
jgi:hypothetical protein